MFLVDGYYLWSPLWLRDLRDRLRLTVSPHSVQLGKMGMFSFLWLNNAICWDLGNVYFLFVSAPTFGDTSQDLYGSSSDNIHQAFENLAVSPGNGIGWVLTPLWNLIYIINFFLWHIWLCFFYCFHCLLCYLKSSLCSFPSPAKICVWIEMLNYWIHVFTF